MSKFDFSKAIQNTIRNYIKLISEKFNFNEKQEAELLKLWNNKENQRNNSECGIYSIYFLTQRLHGNTFDDIIKKLKKKRSADYLMNSLRDIFFINSKYYNLKDMEAYEY